MPPNANANGLTEEELLHECRDNFYLAATIQGRIAYLLMSIHVVNPNIIGSITDYEPSHILFSNMVYGMAVHLFSRPSMTILGFLHRLSFRWYLAGNLTWGINGFSVLGSMMFNHSSLLVFEWVKVRCTDRPYLGTFLGFIFGRMMMVHLLAFMYHVDTRNMVVGNSIPRDATYETIYL